MQIAVFIGFIGLACAPDEVHCLLTEKPRKLRLFLRIFQDAQSLRELYASRLFLEDPVDFRL